MDKQTEREFRNQIYGQLADVCKAFANAHRLKLLELLAQGEHSVDKLAQETGVSVASVSQHLQNLRVARLVVVRREGVKAHYRLADENVFRVLDAARILGVTRLAEIGRLFELYLPGREEVGMVKFIDLLDMMGRNEVYIIDARPESEYFSGHISGSCSIPAEEIESRIREIPMDHEVIVYCRGPFSILADNAVDILRKRGYRARRLELGFPEWQFQGFPVENCEVAETVNCSESWG